MAMVELAAGSVLRCRSAGERPVSLAELAQAQLLSLAYLEQLFAHLRRAGLVASARGPGGGYRLARGRRDITVAAIVDAVDEPIQATRCEMGPPGCRAERCLTHDLWEELGNQIQLFLARVTLHDVVERQIAAAPIRAEAPPSPARRCRWPRSSAGRTRRLALSRPQRHQPLRPEARRRWSRRWGPAATRPRCMPRAARRAGGWTTAREAVAARFGARAGEVVFTSGGTEANALAVAASAVAGACWSRRSSTRRAEGRARGRRDPGAGRTARVDLAALERDAGRQAGAGLGDVRQQRDRRDAADRRGRALCRAAGRAGALRCGAGRRQGAGRSADGLRTILASPPTSSAGRRASARWWCGRAVELPRR